MTSPDKTELRSRMRAWRRSLGEAGAASAESAAGHVPSMLAGLSAAAGAVAAVYRPLGSEMDPGPVAGALCAAGFRLALPRVEAYDAPLAFRAWSPGDPLEPDLSDCAAPLDLAEVVEPDLVIVPLLAFDAHGGRLGQGGGYYDRTMAALRSREPRPAFVGLAFAGQQVDALPHEPHDERLDGVLTEAGFVPALKDY